MIYSSPEFLLLFAATLAAYLVSGSYRVRFLILLAASAAFYLSAGLFDGLVFALVIGVSWLSVAASERFPRAKGILIPAAVILIAAHLLFWKYTPWIVGQVQAVFPSFMNGRELFLPLPLGISFFTLQSIAYLVDYSSGEIAFVGLPLYALFKMFFAQLVAGPIVRGSQLLPQLQKLERPDPSRFSLGLSLFALGFFKKTAVADRAAFFVDVVFAAPEKFGRRILIKALLGYTVQIWADFSGYTDMGRGAALMLGIRLPENFLSPWLSQSPSEFWQRWHITLSQWIRDYIFTPLALRLQRVSAQGIFLAGMITMIIAGLWHGAAWNYAVFGLYHGALLVLERKLRFPKFPNALAPLRRVLRTAQLFALVVVGWMIFRIQSRALFWTYVRGIAFDSGAHEAAATGRTVYWLLALCFGLQLAFYYDLKGERWIFLDPLREAFARRAARRPREAVVAGLCAGSLLAALVVAAIVLRPPHSRGFIYFQF